MPHKLSLITTAALLAASTLACASFGQSKTSEVIYASLSEAAAASGDAEVIADAQQLDGADLDNGTPGRRAAVCLQGYAKAARSERELPAVLEEEQAKLDAQPISDKDKQRTMNIRRSARYNEVKGNYQSCVMSCKDATRAPDYAELTKKYLTRCDEQQIAASRGATYVRLEQRINAFNAATGLNAYYSANELNGELNAAREELPDDPKVAEYGARAEQLKAARKDELTRAHTFINSPAALKNRGDYKTITADIAVIDANIKTWKNDRERVRALNESRAARQATLRQLDDEFTRLCKEAKVCKN